MAPARIKLPLALFALLLVAPTAHAGMVDVAGNTVVFVGGAGEDHPRISNTETVKKTVELSITERGGARVEISGAARAAGCRYYDEDYTSFSEVSENEVVCPILSALRIELGGGHDTAIVGSGERMPELLVATRVNAGPGDDRVDTGPGADEVYGGDGSDTLDGEEGNDRLYGEAGADSIEDADGDDLIDGGDGDDALGPGGLIRDGADVYIGGAGVDQVSYARRTNRIAVTFDGKANDGTGSGELFGTPVPAEADNVASDIEIVEGGKGDDDLYGDARPNVLRGGPGIDELYGGGGDDLLDGGAGADKVIGDDGNDTLIGNVGKDIVTGGPGSDRVLSDTCDGGPCLAGDFIGTRDGARDVVRCGNEDDKVSADKLDEISAACAPANVEREPPPPVVETTRPDKLSILAPGGMSNAGLAKRGLFIKMRCRTGCTINVRALVSKKLAKRLRLKGRSIGAARRTFKPGQVRIRIPLKKKTLRRLRAVRGWRLAMRGKAFSGKDVYPIRVSFPVAS